MIENEIITTFEEWCNNHCEAMCTQTIPCSDCGIGTAKLVLKLYKGQKAEIEKIKKDLKYYLDTNEENGVVYIPKFTIDNLVKAMVGETNEM